MWHASHACQRGLRVYIQTCQKRANIFHLPANVPINARSQRRAKANHPKACQFLKLACQRAKRRAKFSTIFFFKKFFQYIDFSIIVNVCKFQKYLVNSRKLISRKKEFKFRHFLVSYKHYKSCWKSFHHVIGYETTLGTTLFENIIIRNGKKHSHNKVSYN